MEEVQRLEHEIELRQSELEQQNEELRKTQRRLEAYKDRYVDLYDFAPLGYVTFAWLVGVGVTDKYAYMGDSMNCPTATSQAGLRCPSNLPDSVRDGSRR